MGRNLRVRKQNLWSVSVLKVVENLIAVFLAHVTVHCGNIETISCQLVVQPILHPSKRNEDDDLVTNLIY